MDKKIELVNIKYEPQNDAKERMDKIIKMLLSKAKNINLCNNRNYLVIFFLLYYIMTMKISVNLIALLF